MFTLELCNFIWPSKFKPDLPPRYDGTADPTEFLQLYEPSIKAASSNKKIMVNWFPMALKDGACSWLLDLPVGSVSSWEEMRSRFIANFQGTRDYPPTVGDLRRVKQQPGETLHKYIQRFNNVRLKIPKVSDECRCQNRRISGRGSRYVRLRLMVTGSKGHNVYPGSGPLDGGKTLLPD